MWDSKSEFDKGVDKTRSDSTATHATALKDSIRSNTVRLPMLSHQLYIFIPSCRETDSSVQHRSAREFEEHCTRSNGCAHFWITLSILNDGGGLGIWEALELLNTLVDESDPDVLLAISSRVNSLTPPQINLSQIDHLLQTAESIRHDGKPEWMQVTGLVHDLGETAFPFRLRVSGFSLSSARAYLDVHHHIRSQWDVVGVRC